MLDIINRKAAAKYAEKYFDTLSKTGYLKESTTKDYIRYFFLIDFIEHFYDFLSEYDYELIGNLLRGIFSHGDCLLSYPMFCERRNIIGLPRYMGKGTFRITENKILRSTEENEIEEIHLRAV